MRNILESELEKEMKKKKGGGEARKREKYIAAFEVGRNPLFRLWISRN